MVLLVRSNDRHVGLKPLGGVLGSHGFGKVQVFGCIERFGGELDSSSSL
jgi:hypothetical protein